jgi:hypothetical protein
MLDPEIEQAALPIGSLCVFDIPTQLEPAIPISVIRGSRPCHVLRLSVIFLSRTLRSS